MSASEVATVIEAQQLQAGQLELIERARTAPKAGEAEPLPMPSSGIPSFGEKTVVEHRPKIEVIGEVCESCSA